MANPGKSAASFLPDVENVDIHGLKMGSVGRANICFAGFQPTWRF